MNLTERAWKHIRERHPEVSSYKQLIGYVMAEPELIIKGKEAESKAVRYVPETHLGPKYLVVVYREGSGRKPIITAYFTSDLTKIRGEVVWRA